MAEPARRCGPQGRRGGDCAPAASNELRFLLQLSPGVAVLSKGKTPERIRSNIDLSFTLSADQMSRLTARERCYRYLDMVRSFGVDCFGDG